MNLEKLSIEITGKCNLRCIYCCRGHLNTPEKISKELTTSDIIKIIRKARKIGCKNFLFTGGEPFLKEGFSKILKECSGCYVEVFSNGTLISTPENLYLIKTYVSQLVVSLDGLEAHNFYRKDSDYLKIINNIKKVKTNYPDIKVRINTMLNNRSIKELLVLYEKLKELKINEWHIDFPQLRGRLSKYEENFCADYKEIGEILKKLLIEYYRDSEPFYLKIYKVFTSKLTEHDIFEPDLNKNPCSYYTENFVFIDSQGRYILCPSIPTKDAIVTDIFNDDFKAFFEKKKRLDAFVCQAEDGIRDHA